MNRDYNLKSVYRYLGLLMAVCAVMKLTGGVGVVLAVPFVFAALFMKKVDRLTFWTLLFCASPTINPFFMPKGMVYAVTYRAVLLTIGVYGSLLFLSRRPVKELTPLLGLFLYLFYMIIPSSQGWAPLISFLKLILFTGIYLATIYIATEGVAQSRVGMNKFRNIILAFACFYVFGSILVYPFPAISQMNAAELLETGTMVTSLYKGMANHSQSLGMVICFWVIFLYTDLIYNIRRMDKLYIALLLCGFFLIFKSSSRTAMGTMGMCILIASWYLMKMRGIGARWRGKVVSGLLTGLALACVGVLLVPNLRNSVVKFALKYADESNGALEFDSKTMLKTRQFLVDRQMYNFHRKPAIGWGFQVSEEVGEMAAHSDHIPLTAPVEKGVWVTAILEEGGVFGEIIYCVYALIALGLLVFRKAYFGAVIFWAMHISNMGEFTMFSMSGAGGMWYMFLCMAILFDVKRKRELRWRGRGNCLIV